MDNPSPKPAGAGAGSQEPRGGDRPEPSTPKAAEPSSPPFAKPVDPNSAARPEPSEPPTADRAPGEKGGEAERSGGASAHPGAGTTRGELRNEADALYVVGDQVAGNKYTITIQSLHGRSAAPLRPLAPWLRDPPRFAFVEPEGWTEMRAHFGIRRTTIVQGPVGAGKAAVAIRLLDGQGDGVTIFALPSDVDLARLAETIEQVDLREDHPGGVAFLLNDVEDVAGLRAPVLRDLESVLTRAEARLVITVTGDFTPPDLDVLDHIWPVRQAPTHREVVESHLRWWLSGPEVTKLLVDPDLGLEIDKLVSSGAPLKRAHDLSSFVRQHTAAGKTDMPRVRALMARRGEQDFDIWFHGLTDDDRCFAVALAVLNGRSYQKVTVAAQALRKRLRGNVAGGAKADRGARPRVQERLHDLRAESVTTIMRGVFGGVAEEGVRYADNRYPNQVIERFWKEYDHSEPVLAWLQGMAEDPSEAVRVRAATALGLLAQHSFEHLQDRVFSKWAEDEKWERREAVANALRVPARLPKLRTNVLRVVGEWHAWGTPETKATAARVYGVLPGHDLSWALERLGRLLTVRQLMVAESVGDSLSDLTYVEEDGATEEVLVALCRWLCRYKRDASGQYALLIYVISHITEMPDVESGGTIRWPTLLVRADRNPVIRSRLVSLWARVCEGWYWHRTSMRVLTDWAGMAEVDADLRKVFANFIGAVAGAGGRTAALLQDRVDVWGDDDHLTPLPLTVAEIRRVTGWPEPGAEEEGERK